MTRLSITLFLAALLLQAPAVRSAPLDKASCERLKAEQGQLEQAGVRASMAKGPEWAKVNLAPDKLDQVRRLIEVDGQVLFRCDGRPLVALPKEVEADPAAIPAEAKAEGPEATASKPATTTSKPEAAKAAPVEKKAPQKKAAVVKEKAEPTAKAQPKEAPAKKAPAPPKAPAKAKEAAAPPAGEEAAKAKPKPKPKTKADDAYRPLSPDPGINPFANQAAPASKN